jgi:sugar phosphate isomerase/epimerase
MQIGAMFWAGGDPHTIIREWKALGAECGQIAIPGDLPLKGAAAEWYAAIHAEHFPIATVFCAYSGESYTDIPTVEQTVGFIPPATRAERLNRTLEVSDFAAAIGVKSIACHVGFVPADPENADYLAVREMVRKVCDHAAHHGQTFALETGQEPAEHLLDFFTRVGRENLGINFDPANMVLYGTGDPIQALELLAPHVISVHGKDGTWPPKGAPHALGTEVPLGQGAVGMEQFMAKLKQVGYTGTVNVEREVENYDQKKADVAMGIALLKKLRG